MRLWVTFLAMILFSCMFLGFKDSRTALNEMPGEAQMTEAEYRYSVKLAELYRSGYYINPYLFSGAKVSPPNYVNDIVTHCIIIILIWILLDRSHAGEIVYVRGFLIVQALDLLDYLLTHNDPYIYIVSQGNSYPISFNIVSVVIYGLFCTYITLRDEYRPR